MDAAAGSGSRAGLVAVAAVSAAVTLATVRLYRCVEADFRKKIQLQHGARVNQLTNSGAEASGVRTPTARKKKKVRFADDVVEPSSNNEEYRRRRSTEMAFERAGQC